MNPQMAGSGALLQGSSPNLQGSRPNLQMTFNPQPAVATFNLNQSGGGGIPIAARAAPVQAAPGGGGGGGAGGGGTVARAAAAPSAGYGSQYANNLNAGAINQEYDVGKNFYTGLLGTVAPQQAQDVNNTNQYYGDQLQGLTNQRDNAFAGLDQQTKVANDSYTRSLQDLGNSIRNQYQAGSNQLGTQGAADSSAGGMLGYALGQQQNLQRGYMNQDLNNQLGQVGLTRKADQDQYENQTQQTNDLKQQQLTAIGQKYAQLVQNINQSLAQNEQARLQAMRYAGVWAGGQVAQVNSALQGALGNIRDASNPANMPHAAAWTPQTYTAHNIAAPTVNVQSQLSQPISTQPITQIYDPYKDQNPLGA